MLIDSHCHLFMQPLSLDLDGVLARASEAGVGKVVVPAFDTASWEDVALISQRPGVYPALGLHPWKAEEGLEVSVLADRIAECGAVAVGEVGLDGKAEPPGMEVQVPVLLKQLDLAMEMDLPVILHCRGAFQEMFSILSQDRYSGRLRGVLHAFTRGTEVARRFIGLGMHLGFGGGVTRPRAVRARKSAVMVPIDRILLETDAPSIGMDGLEPEKVEPAHVSRVAAAVAELRGSDTYELALATTSNAERLFGIDGG